MVVEVSDTEKLEQLLGEFQELVEQLDVQISFIRSGRCLESLSEFHRIYFSFKVLASTLKFDAMISLFQALDTLIIDAINDGRRLDQPVLDLLEESSHFMKKVLQDLQKGLYQTRNIFDFSKKVEHLLLPPHARHNSPIMMQQRDIFLELGFGIDSPEEFRKGDGNYFECQVVLEKNVRFKKTRIFVVLRGLTQKDPGIKFGRIIPPLSDLIAERFDRQVKFLVKSKLTLPEITSVFENTIEIEQHKIQQFTPDQAVDI